ncbi:MAG: DNA gyrase inhibitor YacG [Asticcacaulis sp.]
MTERKCARCRTPYQQADESLPNAAKDYTPFCSKRCADIDLGHWLKGDYVIDGSGALGGEPDENGASADLSSSFSDEEPE